MGRPKGAKNKKTLERERAIKEREARKAARTDDQILVDIRDRFDLYEDLIYGTYEINPTTNALVVSGSAGIGKSYTAEWVLKQSAVKNVEGFRYRIIRGMVTPIELYELAYTYQHPRNVLVLDDADMIFDDEIGLNILKSLLDTSIERKVNWLTDHPRFKGDNKLEKEFTYNGSMIFLTNKDFQKYIDEGNGKYVPHMEAIMSRSIYLDLKLHDRRDIAIWARHLVLHNGIIRDLGTTLAEEKMLVDWLYTNRNKLREISIRTAIKLGRIFVRDRSRWEHRAKILFLKEEW